MRAPGRLLLLLLVAACTPDAEPTAGLDLTREVEEWARKADTDWADDAAAEVIRLSGLTADRILDLVPSRAEKVCRILAHLDDARVRGLLLELLRHPDSRSGAYRTFLLDAAVLSFARARLAGRIPDTKPLEEVLRQDLAGLGDWRWFSLYADAVEALSARALLPDLRAALARLRESAKEAGTFLTTRTVRAHRVLNDPGALELARELLGEGPVPEQEEIGNYLHRHLPGKYPLVVPDVVKGLPDRPGWRPPRELAENPRAVRFLARHGFGNDPLFLLRFIQPPLSRSRPRWHAEERNYLQQFAELANLFAIPLPGPMNDRGEPDPYGAWAPRLTKWWETRGHQLVWKPELGRYAP